MRLEHDSLGAGPPVAILHGLFGSRNNWRTIARSLAINHRVHLLDARNHGRSPHAGSMTYADQVEDLVGWMRSQDLASCSLVGHSMGGKTAMLTALLHPRAVERLVVVDVAPVGYRDDAGHASLIAAMCGLAVEEIRGRAQADRALAPSVTDPALRAFLLHNLVRSRSGGFAWRINLPVLAAALPALRAFHVPAGTTPFCGPALVLRAGASGYIDEGGLASIHALFPHAQVDTFPGAGHWLHAEHAGRVADRIGRFLDGSD